MIAFFGASITKQMNGYAVQMKKMLQDDVAIFGFGGMHLNNAGICFIDDIIRIKPSFCFIDWFSTANTVISDDLKAYIDTLVFKFTQIECKLIFLFFPHIPMDPREEYYHYCKKYLTSIGIFYIDVSASIKDMSGLLRDGVHTTPKGSKIYADIILDAFSKKKNALSFPKVIQPTRFINIKKYDVHKIFDTEVKLNGNKGVEIIGFRLTVGPHSGLIRLLYNQSDTVFNTWDRWCYYYRNHFDIPHFNSGLTFEGIATLEILQDRFDTDECTQKMDFSAFDKCIMIHDIFYVGDQLTITNTDRGKPLPYFLIYIWNFKQRVLKLLRRYIR